MAKLKFLFIAEYFDGTIYRQNKEDTSIKFPPIKNEDGTLSGKSSFSDIKDDVLLHKIKSFSLIEDVFPFRGQQKYSVDLEDGSFTINGKRIIIEGDSFPQQADIDALEYTLIYFRTRKKNLNMTSDKGTGEILGIHTTSEDPIQFVLGWQCGVDGKNYQQKIRIE